MAAEPARVTTTDEPHQQPEPHPPSVEGLGVDATDRPELTHEDARGEAAGDSEEHVDTDEAALKTGEAGIEGQDGDDRDCAEALDIRPEM